MKQMLKKSTFIILLFAAPLITTAFGQHKPEWREFEEAVALGDQQGKLILIDVGAAWCGWCQKMKQEVYPKLDKQITDTFIFTRLDRDDNESIKDYAGRNLSPLKITQELGVQQIPSVVILNERGEYLIHTSGFISSDKLQSWLKVVASGT